MWQFIIPAIASLAGGYLSGQGDRQAANIAADSADRAAQIQREMYRDAVGRAEPWRIGGINALDARLALYGLRGSGGSSGNINPFGAVTDSTGNPYGQSDVWSAYLRQNPDVANYWAGNAKLRQLYPNVNDFAAYHYSNFGQREGRVLPSLGAPARQTDGGAAPPASENANPLDAYQAFLNSAQNRAASEVNDVDFAKIKGQLGAAGKSISGPGEARYASTLARNRFNALQAYDAGLAGISGTGFDATSNINALGQTTAANVGTATQNAGNARAGGYADQWAGIGRGISGAVDALSEYGKKNWGWS